MQNDKEKIHAMWAATAIVISILALIGYTKSLPDKEQIHPSTVEGIVNLEMMREGQQ